MKIITALLVFVMMVFIGGRMVGQNLVPNGSFEELTSCPQGYNGIDTCLGWFTESWSPDCLATCTSFSGILVPNNHFGIQSPFEGENYAGGASYNAYTANLRETFGIKFIVSLVIGHTYHFSMRVSWAYEEPNGARLACNHLGAKFSIAQHINDYPFS